VYNFTTQTKVAPTYVASLTEATDYGFSAGSAATFTEIDTSYAAATAAVKGILGFVSDQIVTVAVLDALPQFTNVLARTMMEQYETDLLAFTAFTLISGAAGTTTGFNTLLAARTKLASRDVHNTSLVAILHTKQVGDIQQDIASSGSTFLAGSGQGTPEVLGAGMDGYVGSPMGIPIYQTSVVPTGDTATSRVGALFASGIALGLYELWGIRTELQRVSGAVGTQLVLTFNKGIAKIDNNRGQTVKGSA
jgi:hypothetical protein